LRFAPERRIIAKSANRIVMRKSSVIAIAVAAVLAICLVLERQRAEKLRKENLALREQLTETNRIAAEENQLLSKRLADARQDAGSSAAQLKELLRLRAEVSELHKVQDMLTASAKTRAKSRPKPPPEAPPESAPPGERQVIMRDSLQFSGYATPEAALQSTIWAMVHGDATTFLEGLAPAARESYERQFEGKSPTEMAALLSDETREMRGLRLDNVKSSSNDEIVFVIASHDDDDGVTRNHDEAVMKFKKVGGEWKYAPGD
jgi:sensor c-di-GMP phosphodiesterase-like protein